MWVFSKGEPMSQRQNQNAFCASLDVAPLEALVKKGGPSVLAIVTKTQGPSYRSVGSIMAFLPGDVRIGSLSSGCVEGDLSIQAGLALEKGKAKTVLYGQGSPYIDIQLPCGGGLEIVLVPQPDLGVLQRLIDTLSNRLPGYLAIDLETGTMESGDTLETRRTQHHFVARYEPQLQFFIFGKGPEATTFAELSQTIGYQSLLLSPDDETINAVGTALGRAEKLLSKRIPPSVQIDAWSAVVLFFHDHDWEPPIIAQALNSDAFYIGAQGSQRARDARFAELMTMGVDAAKLQRVRGPIGLVPSARDPRTLAVSVMAEILAAAQPGSS